MTVLVVTGTGTGVGKTIVTAAIAALALAEGQRVAVVKPAQTGVGPDEPGDIDVVVGLSGCRQCLELTRFPDPLAPATAARRANLPPLDLFAATRTIRRLDEANSLVLVEGAGGLLVQLDDHGGTLADLTAAVDASLVVVTAPGLGTLNHTALTLEVLTARTLALAGVVIGSWPFDPDLASRCNLEDLEDLAGRPLSGALIEGAGELDRSEFLVAAREGLGPALGGSFDPQRHRERWRP